LTNDPLKTTFRSKEIAMFKFLKRRPKFSAAELKSEREDQVELSSADQAGYIYLKRTHESSRGRMDSSGLR
jgi:hypothetical protein